MVSELGKRQPRQAGISFVAAATFVALELGAFALYTRTLGTQSLWFDEGLSVAFASRSLPEVMHTLIYEDLHPPLYYLLLHIWMALSGTSEWAVRLPSALAILLLLPVAYATVRELWMSEQSEGAEASQVGLAAGALIAASPFLAYYAQETRMYALVALLSLAATCGLLRALRKHSLSAWCAFSVLFAASLYAQYFAAFLLPAFFLYVLIWERTKLRSLLLSLILAAVLYLPWLFPTYQQMGRLLRSPDYWTSTRINLRWFVQAMWTTFFPDASHQVAIIGTVLALIVLQYIVRHRRVLVSSLARRSVLVLLTVLIPLALTYAVVSLAPKFAARYAIVAAAPLYIVLATALQIVAGRSPYGRWTFALVMFAAVSVSMGSAMPILNGAAQMRDDARGLANYLNANAVPGDALLLAENAPYALQYYYRGNTPQFGVHVGVDAVHSAQTLNSILKSNPRRIWLILWHHEFADPTDLLVTELLRIGREVSIEQQFHGYQLRAFDILDFDHPIAGIPQPATALDATFAPGLSLLGWDRITHEAGRWHYVFYWSARNSLFRNYSLNVSLRDGQGNVYLQWHQAMSTDYFLPPAWPTNTPIRGRADIVLPADLPSVPFVVYLSVYDPVDRRPVDVLGAGGTPIGSSLLLEEVILDKASLAREATKPDRVVSVDMGKGLELFGHGELAERYGQGQNLALTLWWRASGNIVEDAPVRFRLLDTTGQAVLQTEHPLVTGYPATAWHDGEINRGIYGIVIPSDAPGGTHELQAAVDDRWVSIGMFELVPVDHLFERPPMQYSLDLPFEQGISLLGYDLPTKTVAPGGTLTLALYWQASQSLRTSYKVSVQLLSPESQLVAQDDSIPRQWTYPTTSWLPGEIVRDEHTLTLPPQIDNGSHEVVVLLYDPTSGTRLRTVQMGQTMDRASLVRLSTSP